MNKFVYQTACKLLVCLSVLAGFSSSAYASPDDASTMSATSSATTFARPVVFGKFRLLKNGNEIKLGDGFFSNVAALRLYRPEDQEEFTGRVGDDGEFSMQLAPGDYYIENVVFKHQGETIAPETNYVFTVSADHEANYIGTITLETTFTKDYNGVKGTFDRFTVADDCATDCDRRLAELGLPNSELMVDLPKWETQVASSK